MNPKFSFVIPAFNGARSLRETLVSIKNQTSKDFEVIVVDNGSTDKTAEIASSFPEVTVIHCARRGRAIARNVGARKSRGEFLAFVDCDVVLDKDWLKNAHLYLTKYPLDALVTRTIPASENEGVTDQYRYTFSQWKSGGSHLSLHKRGGVRPVINTAACIINRKAFFQLKGFNETLVRDEDLEFSFRLFYKGFLIGGTTSATSYVRFVTSSPLHSRTLSYLRRTFDVNFRSQLGRPLKFNKDRISDFKKMNRGLPLWIYAHLLEIASLSGEVARRASGQKRTLQATFVAGKKSFLFSFFSPSKSYLLKPDINFIFIDDDIYLMPHFFKAIPVSKEESSTLKRIISNKNVKEPEVEALVNKGIFTYGSL